MENKSPLTELAAQLPPDWKWMALFHTPEGFELTAAGIRAHARVAEAAEALDAVEMGALGEDGELRGTVRVAMSEEANPICTCASKIAAC